MEKKSPEKSKTTIHLKIKEMEDELTKTKYNKHTQSHVGLVKAKIALLKEKQETRKRGKGKSEGYTVQKSGDASVILVGFPSVGKSTLLNKLTDAHSAVAAYAFTTLTCIPGMMHYKGAKIQILDVPGIVEGASSGRGRGTEVLSVATGADLVIFLVDVFSPEHFPVLISEVRDAHLRINEKRPDIKITKKAKGGISIGSTVKLTKIDKETIVKILHEFRIVNADVLIRSDISDDQFIDVIEGSKKYVPGLVVLNKIEIASPEQIEYAKNIVHPDILISGSTGIHLEELKELIFSRLGFMRVYCKQQGKKADMNEPMILQEGATLQTMCDRLHRDFVKRLRFARIWGSSKFPGQDIRKLGYELKDQDIVELVLD